MSNNIGYAVLDFETTGFNARGRDRVVEVGIVLLSRDLEVESVFSTLVNPSRDMGAAHIHQIQTSWILDAPSFSDLVPEIHNLLRNRAIIAHNASFDCKFWDAELARINRTRSQEFACSLLLARRLLPQAPSHKLGALVEFANLPIAGRAHRALADAEMAASLLTHLADELRSRYGIRQVTHELLRKIQGVPKAKVEQVLAKHQQPH